jgi:hypothetical protein
MGFIPISIDQYVKVYLKSNPTFNENELRKGLQSALTNYNNGITCSCGAAIWVIGSAIAGNGCFTCITGESYPTDDYEIDSAIKKKESNKGKRHIDDMDKTKISGFFTDDGYEINVDLIPKPALCITCQNVDNPEEEILCTLTRHDQKDDENFNCFAYRKK